MSDNLWHTDECCTRRDALNKPSIVTDEDGCKGCLVPTWHAIPCSHLACYSLFPPGMLCLVPTLHALPCSHLACYALFPSGMLRLVPTWHATPCSHLACYALFAPGMLLLIPTWHATPCSHLACYGLFTHLACYASFPPGMYVGPGTAGNREEGNLVQLGKGVDHVGAEAGLQGKIRLTFF